MTSMRDIATTADALNSSLKALKRYRVIKEDLPSHCEGNLKDLTNDLETLLQQIEDISGIDFKQSDKNTAELEELQEEAEELESEELEEEFDNWLTWARSDNTEPFHV